MITKKASFIYSIALIVSCNSYSMHFVKDALMVSAPFAVPGLYYYTKNRSYKNKGFNHNDNKVLKGYIAGVGQGVIGTPLVGGATVITAATFIEYPSVALAAGAVAGYILCDSLGDWSKSAPTLPRAPTLTRKRTPREKAQRAGQVAGVSSWVLGACLWLVRACPK